ncbi:MAG: diguanylate cyclase [Sulfuricurvum sp.]|uniref:diguanylate cyclase n=1 Tax=Sulfuricurvum sp. TaxID=2025608 RepID=UPI002619FF22|nr:diguanylate cyclase [Sulfuricurvum sp.]MDD5161172.1 diguanylate cyclase [Sulfuricurvum sp.]
MNHLKIKIFLILSSVIVSVAMIITTYNIIHDKEQNNMRMQEAYQSVHLNFEETIRETVHFYTARANSNIRSPEVIDAFRSRDHDKLYRLIFPRWTVMRKENPSLVVMQFHNADGTSLLRMHQPKVYGDPIASQRPMVAYVHKHHTIAYGFEEGRQGLAFRILIPVTEKGRYLGAVEFGLSTAFITEKIYRHTGYASIFFIRQNFLGVFAHVENYIQIGNYIALDIPAKLLPLVEQYKKENSSFKNSIIHYDNQSSAITTMPVKTYLNQSMGAIMFIRPVSDFGNHVFQMIVATAIMAFSLIIVIGFIINKIYDTVANKMSFQEMYSQTVLDAIPSPVIVTDGHELIAANQTFLAYLHYGNVSDFKRDHACVCEYFEEGDTEDYLMPMFNDQRWTEYISDHPLINHKAKITIEGQTTVFDVKLSLLKFKEESRYVVIFTDISSIQSISMTDPLTGIANRLHFTMVYEHAINVAAREQKPLGIIFFDIDYFKQVNDRYGHLKGDKVLKQISDMVMKQLRKSDIYARWGGEEFVILLPDTSLYQAFQLAEMLRVAIELENFGTSEKITCSFGVAVLEENESAEMLLKRADELLYQAKESGRNRVVNQ